jgi:DNA-binding response OmpR family regulator
MAEKEAASNYKPKVLIIEDDEALVEFMKRLLETNGYEVDFSYNGATGITKVNQYDPDIILLDIMMEVLDGYKVAQHLKSNDETKFIPIIMVTAKSESIDKIRGIKCGVDDYIVKPFNTKELLERIKSLLSKKKNYEDFTEEEKMKTLKDVVGSVNHEINNPLTSIIMAIDSLLIKYKDDNYIKEKLNIIEENSMRIKDIITKLEQVERIVTKEYHDKTNILELDKK